MKRTLETTTGEEGGVTPTVPSEVAGGATEAAGGAAQTSKKDRGVVVWADGCFDMFHHGHGNSLRQAKGLGDYLIVGVHSDAEILKNKGPPVMNEQERYAHVRSCKWVDEVYENAPYTTQVKVLDEVGAAFAAHGDDVVLGAEGVDTYHEVKAANRFKTYPRTKGVSTTEIVGRMLLMTRTHHSNLASDDDVRLALGSPDLKSVGERTAVMGFLPSSRTFHQFSGNTEPKKGDKIGYVSGSFDLFHPGHIAMLQEAKELCDFLIVGVLDDTAANNLKSGNWPVMNLNERVLSVLSCRYLDEVIIGCPSQVTLEFLERYNIDIVFYGSVVDPSYRPGKSLARFSQLPESKLHPLPSNKAITSSDIVSRIIKNRAAFAERNQKKVDREGKQETKVHT
eukprot:TRINITY_DN2608_c0_g1_i1.p1 TRINITY_DN2608_c0_g1~~TRINITY_DN2608_c0_g1_i1.p1  ORF type:complete len:405 (+),score=98.71 TRINITY_DN2608_c0_g1_i1:32-1216(+)